MKSDLVKFHYSTVIILQLGDPVRDDSKLIARLTNIFRPSQQKLDVAERCASSLVDNNRDIDRLFSNKASKGVYCKIEGPLLELVLS